uniref:non-specific serine/threonine protein kinase n=1 Tax=Lotus japonicus TaxID=34305 RepID=I3T551_LOTJA|nr:unknown [Lotus japonicus]
MNLPSIFTTMFNLFCFFLLTTLPPSHSHQPPPPPPSPVSNYSLCEVETYNCGNLTGISYPFWGQNRPSYCGGGNMFNLTCHHDLNTTTVLIGSQNFTVLGIQPHNYTMTLKPTDLNVCSPQQFDDTYLIRDLFEYPTTSVSNITIFYNCSYSGENFFSCGGGQQQQQQQHAFSHVGVDDVELKKLSVLYRCERHVNVPVVGISMVHYKGIIDRDGLERVLNEGFQVKYDVSQSCIYCLGKEEKYCPWRSNGVDFDKQVVFKCYYCSNGPYVPYCR